MSERLLEIDHVGKQYRLGMIGGGMLPKLKSCIKSIENGVHEVSIINGTVKYNLVSSFITPAKVGTTIGLE